MIIFAILLLALLLRLILANQSFWLDEAIQALESGGSFAGVWQIPGDFHPPLFHYLAYFWLKFVRTEWQIRLLPIVLSLGSIGFLYLFIKKLVNKKTAILSCLFLATSPFHIYYSQEFRPYMLSCFLGIASCYFFLKFLESKGRFSVPFILVNIAGIYSLYLFPFILIAQLLVVLIFYRNKIKALILNILISSLSFLVWLPMFARQLEIGRSWAAGSDIWRGSVAVPIVKSLPIVFVKFWLGNISFENLFLYGFITLFLLLLAIFYIKKAWKRQKKETLTLLILLIVPILLSFIISFFIPIIAPKRLLLVQPLFFSLLALGIFSLKKKGQIISIVLALLINFSAFSFFLLNPKFQREQWREAVFRVESEANQEKSIVLFEFSSPFGPWTYYQRQNLEAKGIFNEDFQSTEKTMPQIVQGKTQIFLFEYLYQMTDPGKNVARWLENNNYFLKKVTDFPGVGLIYEYLK